ncbi:MAG: aldo/keto reductase [Phycisphaerae bacterium]|jgi:aryl-alcohol dehydrogenase-like predicted oxidoreductase
MTTKNISENSRQNPLPKRPLGKTGFNVSVIGMGGIVVMNQENDHAGRIVSEIIEKGVNYFDVSPLYGDAELKLGPALKPFRKDVYLACKTGQRTYSGAFDELKKSLKNLQTDHFDIYQLHGLADVEKDVKAALGKDGAIKAFVEAKKNGIIRNIGFSAHTPAAAITAMKEFEFDTIMFPVNFVAHFGSDFEAEVLAIAARQNLGIIGIKAIARRKRQENAAKDSYQKCWYEPFDDPEIVELALNWAFSQNISLTIPPGEESLFRLCLKFAPHCGKLNETQLKQLETIASANEPVFPV